MSNINNLATEGLVGNSSTDSLYNEFSLQRKLSIEEQYAAAKDRLAQLPVHKVQLQKDIKHLETLLRKKEEDEAHKAHKAQQAQLHEALSCYYTDKVVETTRMFKGTPEYKVWEDFIQARIKALAAALD